LQALPAEIAENTASCPGNFAFSAVFKWGILFGSKPVFRIISPLLAIVLTAISSCLDPGESGNLVPKTVAEDLSLPQIALSDGSKIHLEVFGASNPQTVIILHGGPGGSYKPFLPLKALSDTYKIVFWDQRGSGLSERIPNNKLNGEQYLKDLDELVEKYGGNKGVNLIGHSWGGAFATYYAANFPKKVNKLVLLEPGPLNGDIAKKAQAAPVNFFAADTQNYLNSSDYITPENDAKADYYRMSWGFGNARLTPDLQDWRQGYRANEQINRWLGFIGSKPSVDLSKGIENFRNPVLFIAGTKEKRLGKEFQEHYQTKFFTIENNAVFAIDGADHYGIISHEKTLAKIRNYFNG
jgi:proline iminopeptidase